MKKKITLAVICAVLSCVCLIGTTFAWLTDKTDTVTNTFTVGDVKISLVESVTDQYGALTSGTTTNGNTYKLIPGTTLTKDPVVTVEANSETCWLFIKVVKTNNPDTYLDYELNLTGWTELTGNPGVYYREVTTSGAAQPFSLIKNNQVKVKDALTRDNLSGIGANYPTISFTAYAIQKAGFADVNNAWAEVSTLG